MNSLHRLATFCLLLLPFSVSAAASLAPLASWRDREDRIEALRPEGATLSGRVSGIAPGEPVLVEARGPGGTVGAWTETDGRYRLNGLASGKWRVTASLAVDPAHPTHQVAAAVEVTEGAEEVSLDLAFELGDLTLEGRLLGAPAEPVLLRLLPQSRSGPVVLALASGDTGRFIFRRLLPGAYRLRVEDLAGQEVAEQAVELRTNRVVEVDVAAGG